MSLAAVAPLALALGALLPAWARGAGGLARGAGAARRRRGLLRELEALEARNAALREHIRRCGRAPGPAPVLGPDLIEGMHQSLLGALRERVEAARQAPDRRGPGLRGGSGERRRELGAMAAELGELACAIGRRERAWRGAPPGGGARGTDGHGGAGRGTDGRGTDGCGGAGRGGEGRAGLGHAAPLRRG